jgi:hypothetical protein
VHHQFGGVVQVIHGLAVAIHAGVIQAPVCALVHKFGLVHLSHKNENKNENNSTGSLVWSVLPLHYYFEV